MREWKGSLREAYAEYTQYQESPDLFHEWTFISVVSTILGRQVWVDREFYKVWPNHYVILLAGSAECRKSVAVSIGKDLLDETKMVEVSSERITNAALWKQLGDLSSGSGRAEMLIFADELRTFLSLEETQRGVITTLTRLFTCPEFLENKTKTAGVDHLTNCCVNILAATTPSDFGEIVPGVATGSGFVPRLHVVHQEQARPRRAEVRREKSLRGVLVGDLKHIREVVRGPFEWEKAGWDWWSQWYEKEFRFPEDDLLNGWYGRKHDYVVKLGMVLSAMEKDERVLTEGNLRMALRKLDEIEVFMRPAYQAVGSAQTLKHTDAILKQMQKRGKPMAREALLRLNWRRMDSKEFSATMGYLMESGKVEEVPMAGSRTVAYKLKRGVVA